MSINDNINDGSNDKQRSALDDYVTVAIAEDIDLADEYRDILAKNNIPAVTATQRSYSSSVLGTAVMVPESLLEKAQEIIESQQNFDSFLDDAFNDPDNWNNEPNLEDYDNGDNLSDGEEL